ncbi:MAG TPA: CHC2 zinc finger domain-containing protein [Fibrobacteria bacterium]|nr:CHC2 zinc finger domain-containing protein [Fibrobacteria bacterium]
MPRIPKPDLDRLKANLDLAALIRAKGIDLKPHGAADLIGRCPFHDDKTPSLVVTPSKGLWHCMGACQKGGDILSWIMKAEGVSFRHAVELLREGKAATLLSSEKVVKVATIPKLPPPVTLSADDQTLLNEVADYYHQALQDDPTAGKAREYLQRRGIADPEAVKTFRLGYANRTLGLRLPDKNREAGAAIRGRLEALGVFRQSSGHEHLAGSLVIPILDAHGNVQGLYGRKILDHLRPGTAQHLYLPGPHRGIWNPACLHQKEIILCEALIDALSFWVHGFRNVTAAFGVEGFTEEMLSAFLRHGVQRVYIAYDRDAAGDKAAEKLAGKLLSEGIECLRVLFPHGMDANAYIHKMTPETGPVSTDQALKVLLHGALWLGKGVKPAGTEPPAMRAAPSPVTETISQGMRVDLTTGEVLADEASGDEASGDEASGTAEPVSTPAAPALAEGGPVAPALAASVGVREVTREQVHRCYPNLTQESAQLVAQLWELRKQRLGEDTPLPPYPGASYEEALSLEAAVAGTDVGTLPAAGALDPSIRLPHTLHGEDVLVTLGNRAWRVRGLSKNLSFEVMKVNLRVTVGGRYYIDQLDLYNAKHRESFVSHAAPEVEEKMDVLKRDLGRILLLLEQLQEDRIQDTLKPKADAAYTMTAEEEAEALALLKAPDLTSRILEDLTTCGYVGEETNKLMGYLAATSRKMDDPLHLLIQSSSAAGKSSLMDAILALMPQEDVAQYSALTGQALFYMGGETLRHKILAIAEDGGMEKAAYALKLLMTDKKLKIAAPGKDLETGKLITQTYSVEGPAAAFYSTTSSEVDAELQNRCITLTVDESEGQTEAILALQRFQQTAEGKQTKRQRDRLRKRHQNAQRLLKAVEVVNPYAAYLTFHVKQSRLRRDQMKYLGLMNTLALLHQYQRPQQRDAEGVPYVEVTLKDIALANRLAAEVLGRTLDELAPQTRRLLELLTGMVARLAAEKELAWPLLRLSRWDIRKATGWSDTALKVHLRRLVEMEYLVIHRSGRGLTYEYELLYRGEGEGGGRFLLGLIDVESLRKKAHGHVYDGERSGVNGHRSGSGQGSVSPWSGGSQGDENALLSNNDRVESEGNLQIPENAYGGEKEPASYPHPHHNRISSPLAAFAATSVADGLP